MLDELLLLSNNDIPFKEAQVNIHQPTIKEISLIGEESFHTGCQFLIFSSSNLADKDKNNLGNKTDFEIFMSIMNSKENVKYKFDTFLVLTLLFPEYDIKLSANEILLIKDGMISRINNMNYDIFRNIIIDMFKLNATIDKDEGYNPADAFAAKIAEKFNKRKQKMAEQKGEKSKVAIFSRYVSILTVGEQKDMNSLMNLTVPQLKDEFKRYQLKLQFDMNLKYRLAGAQDLEEVEDWMKDINP